MINQRKSSREARPVSLLQVMEVTIEIPHNMRYRQGAAEVSVYDLLHFSRSKPQIIRNLRRGR